MKWSTWALVCVVSVTACRADTGRNSEPDMSSGDDMSSPLDMSGATDLKEAHSEDMSPDLASYDMPEERPDAEMIDAGDPCAQISCGQAGACAGGECVCAPGWTGERCAQRCALSWGMLQGPVEAFDFGAHLDGVLWNDPTILRQGDGEQVMWLTAGNPDAESADKLIRVYRATSADGTAWRVDTTPVLEPGAPGQWDDLKVETPSVVQDASGLYHMYYSGASTQQPPGVYAIGHATSQDGITWSKDDNNPIITTVTQGTSDWGVFTVAEPAAVFDEREELIRLYYVSAGGSADVRGTFSVLLATSSDGSLFEHHVDEQGSRQPVWWLPESYPQDGTYRGVSTPAITLDEGGTYHLTYDLVKSTEGQPGEGFEQVAISYASSQDGVQFVPEAQDLVQREDASWIAREVRAPFMVLGESGARIWFAGGAPIRVTGNPPRIDWDNHTESFGYLDGTWVCDE